MGFVAVTVKLLLCLALTAAHLQQESVRKWLRKTPQTIKRPFEINPGDGFEYQCSCQKVVKHPESSPGIKPHLSEEELIREALEVKLNRKSKFEEIEIRNSELVEIEEGILDVPAVLTYQYPDQGDNVLVSVQPVPTVYAPLNEGMLPTVLENRPVLDYVDLPVAQPVDFSYQPDGTMIEGFIVESFDVPILNEQNIAFVVNKQPIKKDTVEVFVDLPKVITHPKTKPHPKGTKQRVLVELQHDESKPTVEASPKGKPHSTVDAEYHEPNLKSPIRIINPRPTSLLEKSTPKKQEHRDFADHPIQPHRKVSGKAHYTKQPSQPQKKASGKGHSHEKHSKESKEGHESPQPIKEKKKNGGKWIHTPGQQEHEKGLYKKPETHNKQEKYVKQPSHSNRKASGKGHSNHKHPKDKNVKEYGEGHGSPQSEGKKKKVGKWIYSPGQEIHEKGIHKKPVQKKQGGGEHELPVRQKHENNVREKQHANSHKKASGKGHYSQESGHSQKKGSGKGQSSEKHPKGSGKGHVEKHDSHPKGKKKKGGKWIFTPGQQEVQKSAHDSKQGQHAPKYAKGHGKGHENKEGHEINHKSGHKKHPKKQAEGHGHKGSNSHKEVTKKQPTSDHGKVQKKTGVKHQPANGKGDGHGAYAKDHQEGNNHKVVGKPKEHGMGQKKKGHGVHQPAKGQHSQGKGGHSQLNHGPKKEKDKKGQGRGVVSHTKHGKQPTEHENDRGGKGHKVKHGSGHSIHPKGKAEGHGKYVQSHEPEHQKKTAKGQGPKGHHGGKRHKEVGKKQPIDHGKGHGNNGHGEKYQSAEHNKEGHPKGKAKGQGQNVAHSKKKPTKGQGVVHASGKSVKGSAKGKVQGEGQYSQYYDEEPWEVIKATPGKWIWQETGEEEEVAPGAGSKETKGGSKGAKGGGGQGESWSWSSEDSSDEAVDDGGYSWEWSSEDESDSAANHETSGSNKGQSKNKKS